MSDRRQKRLIYLESELVVLKQEAADLYQSIREQSADIAARRAKLLRDTNNFANMDRTISSIKDEIRALRQS